MIAGLIAEASLDDAEEILALQKLAYRTEAELYGDWSIPPLMQTLDETRTELARCVVLKAVADGAIVGSVRGELADGVCKVGKLMVHPAWRRRGIGARLLAEIEERFRDATCFELFTGARSEGNIRLYQRHGYEVVRTHDITSSVSLVFMTKVGPGVSE
jgi:ribosomal protein S18 acetylase RimI-like enzyme